MNHTIQSYPSYHVVSGGSITLCICPEPLTPIEALGWVGYYSAMGVIGFFFLVLFVIVVVIVVAVLLIAVLPYGWRGVR